MNMATKKQNKENDDAQSIKFYYVWTYQANYGNGVVYAENIDRAAEKTPYYGRNEVTTYVFPEETALIVMADEPIKRKEAD